MQPSLPPEKRSAVTQAFCYTLFNSTQTEMHRSNMNKNVSIQKVIQRKTGFQKLLSEKGLKEVMILAKVGSVKRNASKLVLEHLDDFVNHIVTWACLCAKHRGGTSIEKEDVLYPLKHMWNMDVPGYAMAVSEQPKDETSKYKTAIEESKKKHGEM